MFLNIKGLFEALVLSLSSWIIIVMYMSCKINLWLYLLITSRICDTNSGIIGGKEEHDFF